MLPCRDLSDVVTDTIADHLSTVHQLGTQQDVLTRIAAAMSCALQAGNTVFWCGNGGSAADAQHLAAELVGRFRGERPALASVALSGDSSVITAIANDYGFDHVFSRQLEALCVPGDVVVGISTSGNSTNVCLALQTARELGATAVALTGEGSRLASIADLCVRIASRDAARIQEAHILCGHILCELAEQAVATLPELTLSGEAQ